MCPATEAVDVARHAEVFARFVALLQQTKVI
jgi:hypothetical protein